MSARDDDLTLYLPGTVRVPLLNLLLAALDLGDGDQVVERVAADPWGDLDEFRRTVYRPLHGESSVPTPQAAVTEVTIEAKDVARIRGVLDGLSESFAGGVPWVGLSERERAAVTQLIADLQQSGG